MGMILFVFVEIMLFAGFISSYLIVKTRAVGAIWPPPNQPRLPVETTALNSIALILSGALLLWAHRSREKGSLLIEGRLALATVLGAAFILLQGGEWTALIAEGLTLTSSTFGSLFYTIVGAHALHAAAAVIALGWAWTRLRAGTLTRTRMSAVAIFWYFVVLVWPFLYVTVYLG